MQAFIDLVTRNSPIIACFLPYASTKKTSVQLLAKCSLKSTPQMAQLKLLHVERCERGSAN